MKSRRVPPGWLTFSCRSASGEVGQCQTERGEPILVGLDHDLGVEPAAHLGRGDADHRLEPRLEPAVGELAQLVEIAVAVEAEPHDRLERRVEAQHARNLGLARQLDEPEAFAHVERGEVHRLAPLELEHDLGEARPGLRAHLAHARDHADRLLDRAGDELLDGLRRGVGVLGLDGEGRVGEVGKQVDGQVLHCEQTEGGHREGGHEHGDRTVDGEAREHGSGPDRPVEGLRSVTHQPSCSAGSVADSSSASVMTRTVGPIGEGGRADDDDAVTRCDRDGGIDRGPAISTRSPFSKPSSTSICSTVVPSSSRR